MKLLELDDVRTVIRMRSGSVRPVDGVSLTIDRGETLGLVGESGSGKTMTGMSIVGLLPPGGRIASGSVHFDGRDLLTTSAPVLRRIRGGEIGTIFQDPMTSLDPTMTVGRQVGEIWRLHNEGSAAQARAAALDVLDLVGVPRPAERMGVFPHQLSGGLRQRVMIAMALVCRPKLLIADEPTTALDVTTQAQILDLLEDLKRQLGMAVLLITHDLGVVAEHADRVAVMYAGKIVEEAATAELFARTRHRYSAALLESIPRLTQDRRQRLYSIPGLPANLQGDLKGCRFAPRCEHRQDDCLSEEPTLGDDSEHPFACFHPVVGQRSRVAMGGSNSVEPVPVARQSLVVCANLTKHFTTGSPLSRNRAVVHAVSDVSLEIAEAETFGLVGESGCGKTTLGHLLVGLEEPTSGTVTYAEKMLPRRRRNSRQSSQALQLMFQDPYSSLDPRMKVRAIVAEPLLAQGVGSRSGRRARVAELLDQVGLPPDAAQRFPHEFSGGQRQRIGLARALALNPRLVIADEPVSALDVSIRSQILNLMRDLQETTGLAYLIISHDLSIVRYMADRIGVMYLGKLVEIGASSDLYVHPAHPYTAGLLAAIPEPDPTAAPGRSAEIVRGELPSAANPPSGCRYHTRCPRAQPICAAVEPAMTEVDQNQQVACHFPLHTARDAPLSDKTLR